MWWGHRIPAYRIIIKNQSGSDPELWVAARSMEEAQEKAMKKIGHSNFELVQDEDVLDTWFSSGLFPFSVMGWPEATPDMKGFFPTSLLETGTIRRLIRFGQLSHFSLVLIVFLLF